MMNRYGVTLDLKKEECPKCHAVMWIAAWEKLECRCDKNPVGNVQRELPRAECDGKTEERLELGPVSGSGREQEIDNRGSDQAIEGNCSGSSSSSTGDSPCLGSGQGRGGPEICEI